MHITTTGKFPNKDITHKPKRYQSDILKEMDSDEVAEGDINLQNFIPQSVTIESAIDYFSKNATGENKKLFYATSEWLKELRTIKMQRGKSISNG